MTTAKESISTSYNLIDGKMEVCPKNKGKYITSDFLSYGDYDNSTDVQRANVAYIQDNYATNRYHLVIGAYGYTQIYLKNTVINAELICSLDQYCVINDDYYYEYQSDNARSQFMDSSIKDYPVIYKALMLIDEDQSWEPSEKLYTALHHFSNEWNGGETYYCESGGNYYYPLMNDKYDTDDNVLLVYEYLHDNGIYTPIAKDSLLFNPIIDTIYNETRRDSAIYCLVLYSYNNISLVGGGIDYLTSHKDPALELTIDANMSKSAIQAIIHETYYNICEYASNDLDFKS
jgi:hypothetical protein